MRPALAAGLLAALALVATSPAFADEPARAPMTPEAKAHMAQGAQHYRAGAYDEALRAFDAGYRVDPHPDFLYASAQAERQRGRCSEAIRFYRAFLNTNPPTEEAARARANLARCESSGAGATADGASVPAPPAPPAPGLTAPPAPPAPPAPRPAAAAPSKAAPAPKPRPARRRASSPWYTDVLGDVLLGAGIAAGGAGATLLVLADRRRSDANAAPDLAAHVESADEARRFQTVGLATTAAGGALVVAGLVRYWTRPSSAATTGGIAPRVGLGPGLVELGGSYRW